LSQLVGWIGEPVVARIIPNVPGAKPIAGMSGPLRHGVELPSAVRQAMGVSPGDEVLFFHVGEGEDWNRSWFAVSRSQFHSAFMHAGFLLCIRTCEVGIDIAQADEWRQRMGGS
jgi:hypothetical protein